MSAELREGASSLHTALAEATEWVKHASDAAGFLMELLAQARQERDEANVRCLELAARISFIAGQDIPSTVEKARAALVARVDVAEAQCAALQAAIESRFCEAHQDPGEGCPCCEAVHQADLVAALQGAVLSYSTKPKKEWADESIRTLALAHAEDSQTLDEITEGDEPLRHCWPRVKAAEAQCAAHVQTLEALRQRLHNLADRMRMGDAPASGITAFWCKALEAAFQDPVPTQTEHVQVLETLRQHVSEQVENMRACARVYRTGGGIETADNLEFYARKLEAAREQKA